MEESFSSPPQLSLLLGCFTWLKKLQSWFQITKRRSGTNSTWQRWHSSQHWLRLTMHQAFYEDLNFHLIHYSPQACGEGPMIIPFMQLRKAKLRRQIKTQGQRYTHGWAGLAGQAADSGASFLANMLLDVTVSWNQRTPLSINLCQEMSNFSTDSWMYVMFPSCPWITFTLFVFLK